MAKKTGDLNAFIFELTGRVKAVEDDVATDKEDLDLGASKETRDLEGAIRRGNSKVEEDKKQSPQYTATNFAKEIDL